MYSAMRTRSIASFKSSIVLFINSWSEKWMRLSPRSNIWPDNKCHNIVYEMFTAFLREVVVKDWTYWESRVRGVVVVHSPLVSIPVVEFVRSLPCIKTFSDTGEMVHCGVASLQTFFVHHAIYGIVRTEIRPQVSRAVTQDRWIRGSLQQRFSLPVKSENLIFHTYHSLHDSGLCLSWSPLLNSLSCIFEVLKENPGEDLKNSPNQKSSPVH